MLPHYWLEFKGLNPSQQKGLHPVQVNIGEGESDELRANPNVTQIVDVLDNSMPDKDGYKEQRIDTFQHHPSDREFELLFSDKGLKSGRISKITIDHLILGVT